MVKKKRKDQIKNLITLLKSKEERVQEKAMELILRVPSVKFIKPLVQTAKTGNKRVKQKAIKVLNGINNILFMREFERLTEKQRYVIGGLLIKFNGRSIDKVCSIFSREQIKEKIKAIDMMQYLGGGEQAVLRKLMEFLHNEDERIRATAVRALGYIKKGVETEQVLKLLNDKDRRVVANTIEALENLADYSNAHLILPYISDKNNRIRANALKAYFKLTKEDIKEPLKDMIESYDPKMRASAAWLIGELREESYSFLLDRVAFDRIEKVKQNYIKAVSKFKEEVDFKVDLKRKIEPSQKLKSFIDNKNTYKVQKIKILLKLKTIYVKSKGLCNTIFIFIIMIVLIFILYKLM